LIYKRKKKLIEQATSVNIGNNTQSTLQNQPTIFGADSIRNDFDKEVSSQLRSTNSTSVAIINQSNVYPPLFQLMKKQLCILATSVPCEQIFSKAGQTITEKRSRLDSNFKF